MNKFQKEVVKFTKTDLKTVFPFGLNGLDISFYQARKLRKKLLKDLYKRKREENFPLLIILYNCRIPLFFQTFN